MALSVADLWSAFPGTYDFISIDVEGSNYDILDAVLKFWVNTEMICVEYDGEMDRVLRLAQGYKMLYRSNENLILVPR